MGRLTFGAVWYINLHADSDNELTFCLMLKPPAPSNKTKQMSLINKILSILNPNFSLDLYALMRYIIRNFKTSDIL